jgi:hypothetical protein
MYHIQSTFFVICVMAVFNTHFVLACFTPVLYCLQLSPCFLVVCGMYNYRVQVENVLSIADFFGMLTVKIKRRNSTVMSQFSLFACVVQTHEKHLLTLSCLSTWIRSGHTGQIFVKLDIGDFYKIKCEENPHLVKIEQKYWALYVKTYVLCCQGQSP